MIWNQDAIFIVGQLQEKYLPKRKICTWHLQFKRKYLTEFGKGRGIGPSKK